MSQMPPGGSWARASVNKEQGELLALRPADSDNLIQEQEGSAASAGRRSAWTFGTDRNPGELISKRYRRGFSVGHWPPSIDLCPRWMLRQPVIWDRLPRR